MDWRISRIDRTEDEPTGIGRFIMRMDRALRDGGPPIQGFQFLNSGKEMMRITREIEDEVLCSRGSPGLYVGFQKAEKLETEAERYRALTANDVEVFAFGEDEPNNANDVVAHWSSVPRDVNALENQWFLAARKPSPIAFIGWEVSEPRMFGVGGISTESKQFAGLISSDARVVNAMIDYLDQVRTESRMTRPDPYLPDIDGPVTRILTCTKREPDPETEVTVQAAAELALGYSSELILYDTSAASYLVSPYDDSKFMQRKSRILSPTDLNYVGRTSIAAQVEHLESQGVPTGAIIPSRNGLDHMARMAEDEDVDIIVVPQHFGRPTLMQRIRKLNLFVLLDNTDIPVLQCDKDGTLKA